MSPRNRVVTFRPDEDIVAGMNALWERDGIALSEQIRRALRGWLQERGVLAPALKARAAHKRVAARKRA